LLRRLLRDPTPSVRLRAGLALAAGHDPEAVPVLIDLLGELPLAQGRQAEDLLAGLAGTLGPKVNLADNEVSRRNCRDAWRKWWQEPPAELAPSGLLDEVRKRSLSEPERVKVQRLIDDLGDDGFGAREKASTELKALGQVVLPLLRVAAHSRDLEVRRRAQELLDGMGKDSTPPLSPAVPRLLALRRPGGAVEVLLNFLPFAEDELVREEVQHALNTLAAQEGKPDPLLMRALADRAGVRRAAAAEALCNCRSGGEHLAAVRKLLKDPEAGVRARAALALAGRGDREAVPVLIALVGELPADEAGPVEDYLTWLCGDRPPPALSAEDARSAAKRQEAWAAWWEAHGARVELGERPARLEATRQLGFTLLVQPQQGQVVELDQQGKVRWQINGLGGPQDAQVLPGDRVLVAEFSLNKVTERNFKGEVLWQKAVAGQPLGVQRLPGGTTLIVTRNQLLEVDRSGRELFTWNRPFGDLMTARKLRDGQIVCVSNQATCFRLNRGGQEVKSFRMQGTSSYGNDVLPSGGVVVPLSWQNRVTEYDPEGKVVWDAQVLQPVAAQRLPNGHTLVSSQQWPPRIIELDRAGKQVAETPATSYTVRVRRR
jgi:HEAT repeat protein